MTTKLDIARGRDSKLSPRIVAGRCASIDTTEFDIWAGGDSAFSTTKQRPRGGSITTGVISLVSDSPNDAEAGTGMRSARVSGIEEATFDEVEEVVVLNGVTPVSTLKHYAFLNSLKGETAGSGWTNAGNISAKDPGNNLIGAIPVGGGRAPIAAFGIPAGHYGYIERLWAKSGTVAVLWTLYAQTECRPIEKVYESKITSLSEPAGIPWKFEPKTRLWIAGAAASGTTHAAAGFDLVLEAFGT